MNFKKAVEEGEEGGQQQEQRQIQPPPKYSACFIAVPANNSQLPTYNEALKMIEKQNDGLSCFPKFSV